MFGNVESSGETSGCRQASQCCWAGWAKRDRRTGVSQEAVGGLQLGGEVEEGDQFRFVWMAACPPKAVRSGTSHKHIFNVGRIKS